MGTQTLPAGFTTPVHDSQQWYRAILDAMARPGTIGSVTTKHSNVTPPQPCCQTMGAVALTLLDHETPVWLTTNGGSFSDWLKFHCNCPVTTNQKKSVFALIHNGEALPDLSPFSIGTEEFPDKSTTLIIQIDSLCEGEKITLSGAGINGLTVIQLTGLADTFWQAHESNITTFPRGFDTILCAPEGVMCLPRTVTVQRSAQCT